MTEQHVPRCVCGAGSWLGRPLLPTDVVPRRGPAGHDCSCIPAAELSGCWLQGGEKLGGFAAAVEPGFEFILCLLEACGHGEIHNCAPCSVSGSFWHRLDGVAMINFGADAPRVRSPEPGTWRGLRRQFSKGCAHLSHHKGVLKIWKDWHRTFSV